MNVISLRDYAAQKGISYEAVRQQVVRYKDELEGHIIKDGRQQFLDEEAVAYLDAKRQKNPVAIIQQNKDEELEMLRQQKEALLVKVAEQGDKLDALHTKIEDMLQLQIDAKAATLALEAATAREGELRQEAQSAQERAAEAEKRVAEVLAEVEEARTAAAEAIEALEVERKRKLSIKERIFGKKYTKGGEKDGI